MTALSGFTGAGGLDLGLESAGFRILACIENDPTARATLAANRPKRRSYSHLISLNWPRRLGHATSV